MADDDVSKSSTQAVAPARQGGAGKDPTAARRNHNENQDGTTLEADNHKNAALLVRILAEATRHNSQEHIKSGFETLMRHQHVIDERADNFPESSTDDDADSHNEGVVMVAAEHCDASHVNFMARQARGLVCLTLTEERCRQLDLPPMVDDAAGEKSNFTLSIEAAEGIDTGISVQNTGDVPLSGVKLALNIPQEITLLASEGFEVYERRAR